MGTVKTTNIQSISGSGTVTLGTSGETLAAGSGVTIGSGLGKILQVVTATDATTRDTTSTSFVTGSNTLTLNITPASTSNKILIICSPHIRMDRSADNAAYKVALYRDSTPIMEDDATNAYFAEFAGTTTTDIRTKQSYEFLDSPSSTSSITYKLYIANQDAGSSGQIQLNWDSGNINSSLTLMEVSA